MSAFRLRRPRRWLVLAALLAGMVTLGIVQPLAAQTPTVPTSSSMEGVRPPLIPRQSDPGGLPFDATLTLRADGRVVFAVGAMSGCPTGEQGEIHAVITQDSTAAVAFGSWTGACTGAADQVWRSAASALDQPFQPGPARACGVVIFRMDGFINLAEQWCMEVMLVAGH